MRPLSPVIPGTELPEVIYGDAQPEYQPLPVWRDVDGTVLSRWKFTWWERLQVLFYGDLYLWVLTFGQPLQPVMLQVERPEVLPALPSPVPVVDTDSTSPLRDAVRKARGGEPPVKFQGYA